MTNETAQQSPESFSTSADCLFLARQCAPEGEVYIDFRPKRFKHPGTHSLQSSQGGRRISPRQKLAVVSIVTVAVIVAVVVGLATLQPKSKPQSVNKPPVAHFVYEANNLTVVFNASASDDPDGNITSYSWDFGDNSANSTGEVAEHTYPANGTYTVVLLVTDNGGEDNSTSENVTVELTVTPTVKHYPVALIEVEDVDNLTVTLDGANSYALDSKTIVSYGWSYGDGASATGPNVVHTYAANGTYTIELNVTDSGGLSNTTFHTVSVVKEVPPPARHYPVAVIKMVNVTNLTVTVSGSSSYALDDKTIVSYEWSFGDGKKASGANVTHTYAANGTYTITLTVTDSGGLKNTTSEDVTVKGQVTPPPPHRNGPPGLLHAIEIHQEKADRNSGLKNSLTHLEENLDKWLDKHVTP